MKIIDRKFLDTKTTSCHASTIAFFKGEIVYAYFGGQREGLPDQSIYIQYKGETKILGRHVRVCYWNPVLFTIGEELFLSYKVGDFCDRWQSFIVNLTDIENIKEPDKIKPQLIPAGLNFCVKTKLLFEDGIIYCGSSVETSLDWSAYIEQFKYKDEKFIFINRSRPLTVEKKLYKSMYSKVRESNGILQPTLWKDKSGKLNAFFRSSKGLDNIYYSCCENEEWTDPKATEFKNPNASVDVVYFNDRLFLIHNPSDTWRSPLVLSELDDDFKVIDEIVITEKVGEKERILTKELSYPYLIERDGVLYLTYTYGRVKIEYVVIEI